MANAASVTRYVSPSGSDHSPGTRQFPWRTLQYAADHVRAGDTVRIRPGKYAGFCMGWDQPVAGMPDRPIAFLADPGAVILMRNGKTPDGINVENAGHIVIDGFRIVGMKRAGIRVCHADNVTVRNNVCDGNGEWGIFTSHSDNTLIADNIACRSVHQHGIYVSNSACNPVLRGNVIFGNARAGIHMNGDVSQGDSGMIIGAVVENNLIYDNGAEGASAINCDGVARSQIRHNLLLNNHANGISLYKIDGAGGSTYNRLTHNVILMPADARWSLNIRNGSSGNVVFDNVLLNANPAKGSINIDADSLAGFTSDRNLLEDRLSADDGENRISLARWQGHTGQDKHSRKPEIETRNPKPE